MYFSGTFGGVTVFKQTVQTCGTADFIWDCEQRVSYVGPLVGAGAEFRF
jgi:hypothetical protein